MWDWDWDWCRVCNGIGWVFWGSSTTVKIACPKCNGARIFEQWRK